MSETTIPVELQVLGSALRAVAEEMGAVLIRAAFSSNIKERRDCSTALFDRAGRMVVQAEHIPVHLGAMPEAVAAVMARGPAAGRGLGAERPLHRRHASPGHHPRVADEARLRRQPRPSRRRRRHGAREPPGRIARAPPGGADHPADAARRRSRRPDRGELALARRAARRPQSPARRAQARRGTDRRTRRAARGGARRGGDGRAVRLLGAPCARRHRAPARRALRGGGRDRGGGGRPRDPGRGDRRGRRGRHRLRRHGGPVRRQPELPARRHAGGLPVRRAPRHRSGHSRLRRRVRPRERAGARGLPRQRPIAGRGRGREHRDVEPDHRRRHGRIPRRRRRFRRPARGR